MITLTNQKKEKNVPIPRSRAQIEEVESFLRLVITFSFASQWISKFELFQLGPYGYQARVGQILGFGVYRFEFVPKGKTFSLA